MFNDEKFKLFIDKCTDKKSLIARRIDRYDGAIERLKNEILDLSKPVVYGFETEENTRMIREYLGVGEKEKSISRIKVYGAKGDLVSRSYKVKRFKQIGEIALFLRCVKEEIKQIEDNFVVTFDMVEEVKNHTKHELYDKYGYHETNKLLSIASNLGVEPLKGINTNKFENASNRLKKVLRENFECYYDFNSIISLDNYYYLNPELDYNEFLDNHFGNNNKDALNEYLSIMDIIKYRSNEEDFINTYREMPSIEKEKWINLGMDKKYKELLKKKHIKNI